MSEEKIESDSFYNPKDLEKKEIVEEYVTSQITRHLEKLHKIRDEDFYFSIAKAITTLYDSNKLEQKDKYKMICLGTRNNYERDCFTKYFSNVKSLVKERIYLQIDYNAIINNYEKELLTKSAQRKWMRDMDLWFRDHMDELQEIAEDHLYAQSIIKVESLDISSDSEADHIMNFNDLPDDWDSKWDIIYSNCLDHSMSATETFKEWIRVLQKNGILIFGVTFFNDQADESDSCTFNEEQIDKFLSSQENIQLLGFFNVNNYKHYIIKKI